MHEAAHLIARAPFLQQWLEEAEKLTPKEGAAFLARTSQEKFVKFMRWTLVADQSLAVTDHDLCVLHDEMCRRLATKVGKRGGSWEVSAPAGQA